MRKNTITKWIILSVIMILFIPAQSIFATTTAFGFNLEEVQSKVGTPFKLILKGEAILDLYGYEVTLSYDDSKIEIIGKPSVKFTHGFLAGPKRASDNKVYFGFTKIGQKAGEKGNIDLGEIVFKTKENGIHTIVLESVKVVNAQMQSKDFVVGQTITVVATGKRDVLHLKDIKGHWAEKYITCIVEKGYMIGKSENQFKPNDKLTRAEMAKLLNSIIEDCETEFYEYDFETTKALIDVVGQEWYAEDVYKMVGRGILKGYEDRTFKPGQQITRAETIALLARMAREEGTYVRPNDTAGILAPFTDSYQVASWVKDDVAWAIQQGLIMGDELGKLNMSETISRAEIATVLYKGFQNERN